MATSFIALVAAGITSLFGGELFTSIKVSLILVALGLAVAVVALVKNPGERWTWAGILLAFSGLHKASN